MKNSSQLYAQGLKSAYYLLLIRRLQIFATNKSSKILHLALAVSRYDSLKLANLILLI